MNVHETNVARDASRNGEDIAQREGPAVAKSRSGTAHPVMRRLAQFILPLVILGIGIGGYQYLKSTRPEKQKRPTQERVFAIKSTIAKKQALQPTLKLYGTTVAGRQVDIRALVSGRVIEASPALKNGGEVQQGDVLLTIDPFSYDNAVTESQASLAESRARLSELEASIATDAAALEVAKRQVQLSTIDLKRAQPLAKRGTVSKRTVDEREQTLLQRKQDADRLENSIKVWQAKVAQQKAIIARQGSALQLAKRRLEETRLLAPFHAFVVDVSSHVGRMVGANDKIATLIDREWVEAKFTLSDEQYGRLLGDKTAIEGRTVNVIWSLGNNEVVYPATIERVAGRVNAATGGVEVLARITNPNKPVPLRAGAFVEIMVPDKTYDNVVRLPPTALYAGNVVYAISDGRLDERKIKVVGAFGNDILVEGPVKDGERILISRISTPGSGVRVEEVQ